MAYSYQQFPAQKLPFSKKGKDFRIRCINGAEAAAMFASEELRKSRRNKEINYGLYSNILDQSDVEQICNPLKLKGIEVPLKLQNYPLCNPKLDVLIGEERTRGFEYRWRVTNEDAISEKEAEYKEQWKNFIIQLIETPDISEEEQQRRIAEFKKYMEFDWQSLREQRATWICKDIEAKNKLHELFSKGFKDAVLVAEEIYEWDIIAGEPICKRLNPKNVWTVRQGESPYIEDADIILVSEYYPVGKVIDEYHEYLTPAQIDKLESRYATGSPEGWAGSEFSTLTLKVEEMIDEATLRNDTFDYGLPFDEFGNVRVLRVRWKSIRKMKVLTYFDKDGEEQERLVDENYIPNATVGEHTRDLWVSEWWEGTKIAGAQGNDPDAIYVKMGPRKMQYRSMHNPSKCHPGIVGTIYNTNDNKGISIMDRMKPYQYLYNVIWYNTELLIATNWGKIMKIPLHEVPDGWDEEQWLYFAKYMKAVPYDAFKEGKKGAATGKLAGNMNTQSPILDMEMGQSLQFYMMTLQYIEQKMGEIAGVSPQRMGSIQNRETLGGVERSVTQSSMITEYWFAEHEFLKKRVLEVGLETAKTAMRGNKKLMHFTLDNFTSKIAEIDGDEFAEADYGIEISSSWKDKQAFDAIRQLAQAALQGGLMDFGQLLDLWTSDSISAMRKKFIYSEQEKKNYEQRKMEEQAKMQDQALQVQAAEKEAERQHQFDLENQKASNAITLETLKARLKAATEVDTDIDSDGIPDLAELEKVRSQERVAKEKLQHESREAKLQRNFEAQQNDKDREVERFKAKSKPKPKG